MSASLVGSEMCIRDRFLPAARTSLSGAPESGNAAAGAARPGPSPWRWPCLLYTSDAADDM
eukprot:10287844-Alexandrium_andersonii.AAC.1